MSVLWQTSIIKSPIKETRRFYMAKKRTAKKTARRAKRSTAKRSTRKTARRSKKSAARR
jgi:hypothetical protein